jgi:hypothetical protein
MTKTTTHTSSLALWFAEDDGPTQLEEFDAPAVMVSPSTVVAHGLNQVVMVLNMAEGWLAFAGIDEELISEDRFTLNCLACLAGQLPQLVMLACSDPEEPGEVLALQTEEGIAVERVEPGVVALGFSNDASVKVHLPTTTALQFVAELLALLVRQVADTADAAAQLEAALEQSS